LLSSVRRPGLRAGRGTVELTELWRAITTGLVTTPKASHRRDHGLVSAAPIVRVRCATEGFRPPKARFSLSEPNLARRRAVSVAGDRMPAQIAHGIMMIGSTGPARRALTRSVHHRSRFFPMGSMRKRHSRGRGELLEFRAVGHRTPPSVTEAAVAEVMPRARSRAWLGSVRRSPVCVSSRRICKRASTRTGKRKPNFQGSVRAPLYRPHCADRLLPHVMADSPGHTDPTPCVRVAGRAGHDVGRAFKRVHRGVRVPADTRRSQSCYDTRRERFARVR